MQNLNTLFLAELADIYDAETQFVRALPGISKAATLLKGILNEEKDAKKSLKKLARSKSNHEAMAEPAGAGR